jgi:hypothetical protein
MKFTEAKFVQAVIALLKEQNYTHIIGEDIERKP